MADVRGTFIVGRAVFSSMRRRELVYFDFHGQRAAGLQMAGEFLFEGYRYAAGDWIVWTKAAAKFALTDAHFQLLKAGS